MGSSPTSTKSVKSQADDYYEVSREKGVKRKKLAEIRDTQAVRKARGSSGTGSGTNGQAEDKPTPADSEGPNPHFFVDTKPSPVNQPKVPYRPSKRSSPTPEPVEAIPTKKRKKKHSGCLPGSPGNNGIEFEDISAEVDARMQEKEEKRKTKVRKRKRNSAGSSALVDDEVDNATALEKPRRKKSKMADSEISSKKRQGEDGGEAESGDGKAKKKRKKSKIEVH